MNKDLRISLLALTCFSLSAVGENKEVSQAEFFNNVEKALANKENRSFENIAYLAAALYQSKDSSLKILLGEKKDDQNVVINLPQKTLIVKGTALEEDVVLKTALEKNQVKENDLNSTVEKHIKDLKEKNLNDKKKKSNKKYLIIGGIVIAVVVIGVGYYFYSQNQSVDI